MLKKAYLKTPVLSFADFNKPFLLETDMSKQGMGAVLSHKTDWWPDSIWWPIWAGLYLFMSSNYHSTKQEFLALKWVITGQFQEYLHWKLLIVKTDNNSLTYIMTTPNLDTTWHCWVESLSRIHLWYRIPKGTWQYSSRCPEPELHWGWMQRLWSPSWTESLWDQQEEQMSMTQWWLRLIRRCISMSGKLPSKLELPICMWTSMWLIGLATQWEDPVLKAVINWILNWKLQGLKHLLGDNVKHWRREWPSFKNWEKADAVPRSPLSLSYTGWWAGGSYAVCSLPWAHFLATMNGCHMEMLDTRVSRKCCIYYKTGSGGPAWPCRFRRWLATVNNDASNMEALIPKHQCNPSLPLLLLSCYT